jgi:hypothetical protein
MPALHSKVGCTIRKAAVGYHALYLVDQAGTTHGRENIAADLYTVKDFQGASANLSMNEKGSAPQDEARLRIKNGALKRIEW